MPRPARHLPLTLLAAAALHVASFALAAAEAGQQDLTSAQHAFYNARYDEAAAHALESRTSDPASLAAYEVRTSALLFELKRLLGDDKSKRRQVSDCATCPALLAAFHEDLTAAQALARGRIEADAGDELAHFYLAKLDLNYLWLQNGPLGRRTGWKEYREARRSLESALAQNPDHVRAQVALAWIDYIVDTRMPWGTKWMFGGGSRTRAVASMRDATVSGASFYELAEARFGLWEMLLREKDVDGAADVARDLARDFPDNPALAEFVAAQAREPGEPDVAHAR